MSRLLMIQLLVSFFAGGSFIAILSLVAERVNHRVAGVILMFPSTLVLGFLFLGLSTSAKDVSSVIPATLIPLGIIVFSVVVYIYIARLLAHTIRSRIALILCSLIVSTVVWFLLVSPFAIFKFSNVYVGAGGFVLLAVTTHFILQRQRYEITKDSGRPSYSRIQILIRVAFTGSIIALVVLLGKILNPFWGGIFTMFPAATFATLIVLHFNYEPRKLIYFMRNAPMGSASLFLYAVSVMWLFPRVGIWIGTMLAYCVSLTFSLLLIQVAKRASNHDR